VLTTVGGVALAWMRDRLPHTPVHRVTQGTSTGGRLTENGPVRPRILSVVTACGWQVRGGKLLLATAAGELGAYPCARCFPPRGTR
jgi:hypothetical protein